nr:MAG TPA: hypothetical protein [Caudoviricetes sp.]
MKKEHAGAATPTSPRGDGLNDSTTSKNNILWRF